MVLARLRRFARVVAVLVLVSLGGVSHWADDDVCAADVIQAHDESKHVIGAPGGSEPQHCAICHSIRTPQRPSGPAPQPSPLLHGALIDSCEALSHRAPALDNLPARAPPASLI